MKERPLAKTGRCLTNLSSGSPAATGRAPFGEPSSPMLEVEVIPRPLEAKGTCA